MRFYSPTSMFKQDKTPRHSRESGNLSSHTHWKILWLSAFAGMTKQLTLLSIPRVTKGGCLSYMLLILSLCFIPTAQATPNIQTATLNNGLRVLLVEAHNVPMVSMQLSMPAGSRFDPADKAGTSSMLADMLSDHTAQHNQQAWADALDAQAVRFGLSSSRDMLNASLTVVKDTLPAGLDILSEAILHPGWRSERFASLKSNNIAAAIKSEESANTLAAEATAKLLYGDAGYGHPVGGTAKSLQAIRMQDIQALYQAQVKPQGSVLAVSGDITLKELLPLLNARLATWQGKPKHPALQVADAPVLTAQQQHLALPTSQMLVQFSRLGIARSSHAFFPLFVMNHYLGGGGFSSKLMEEVREKRGLVYGVYSYFIPLAGTGPMVITLQTKASQAEQAIQVVRQVMQEMAEGTIDSQRLNAIKKNLTGSFAQRMDSNRERVGLLAMIGFYHMPLNYLQQWTHAVNAVTVADVQNIAHTYLHPDAWNIIQVGPLKEK